MTAEELAVRLNRAGFYITAHDVLKRGLAHFDVAARLRRGAPNRQPDNAAECLALADELERASRDPGRPQ